jgi:hypothetical protein
MLGRSAETNLLRVGQESDAASAFRLAANAGRRIPVDPPNVALQMVAASSVTRVKTSRGKTSAIGLASRISSKFGRGADIRLERPDWNLFRDRCPEGETPKQVSARADNVVSRVRAISGDVLLFTSGHFIRVLAVRWLGLEPTANSRYFMLSTSSLSALGYEKDLGRPVIRFWNDTRHVDTEPESAV